MTAACCRRGSTGRGRRRGGTGRAGSPRRFLSNCSPSSQRPPFPARLARPSGERRCRRRSVRATATRRSSSASHPPRQRGDLQGGRCPSSRVVWPSLRTSGVPGPAELEPKQIGDRTRLEQRERHQAVHHAVQMRRRHVQLSGQLGLPRPGGPAMLVKLAGEALLKPDGGRHPGLDAGTDLGVVGVPRARLDEQVARHVGRRSGHRPAC